MATLHQEGRQEAANETWPQDVLVQEVEEHQWQEQRMEYPQVRASQAQPRQASLR